MLIYQVNGDNTVVDEPVNLGPLIAWS